MSIRREFNKRRQAKKAARATEQGVAGHKSAMEALGRATGWKSNDLEAGIRVAHTGGSTIVDPFTPGAGNITTKRGALEPHFIFDGTKGIRRNNGNK